MARKKPKPVPAAPPAAEIPKSMIGQKNIYTCTKCGAHIVTVDRDDGVTPFMVACKIPACGGKMHSSFYEVFDQRMRAFWEWYKPPAPQQLTDGERAHVDKGGLLLRPIPRGSAND